MRNDWYVAVMRCPPSGAALDQKRKSGVHDFGEDNLLRRAGRRASVSPVQNSEGAPDIIRSLFDRELKAAERAISLIRLGILGVALFVLMPLRTWLYGWDNQELWLMFDSIALGISFAGALVLWYWVRRPDWPPWLSYVGILLDHGLLGVLIAGQAHTDYVPSLGLTIETYKLLIPVALSMNFLSGVRLRRRQVWVNAACCALIILEARALDVWLHGAPVYVFTNALLLTLVGATTGGALFIVSKTRTLIGEASTRHAEMQRVKDVLSRYVSRPVAEAVLQEQDAVPLGTGRRQRVTVMFTDIRGFTSLSERLAPEEVVAFLNTYFSRMVGAVFTFDGMLDKYIGDGMMAVFGAPIAHEDHALRAVKAAFRMRKELEALNVELKARGEPSLSIGIGLHTGECVIGNIGTEQRLDYTAIGDTVNTASRIEGLTKEHQVDILVSADTWREVQTMVLSRSLPAVTLRGRSTPLDLYALEKLRFDDDGEPAVEKTEISSVRW
jgi:class 3 adenylate cyclase